MGTASLRLLPLLLAAPTLTAQTVWNVTGPFGIQPAINAASPGDILVLTASGGLPDYAPFTLGKGLIIRGNGAKVGSFPSGTLPPGIPSAISINIPAGQVAHLVELDFSQSITPFGSLGNTVDVQGGSVRFEQCTMRRSNGTALQVAQADVVVAGGSITALGNIGAGPGLTANQSRVTLRDVTVTGASSTTHPITSFPSPAAPAARLTDSTLHAERATFVGGSHNATFVDVPAAGIDATNTTLWLAGCTVTGGSSATAGATALVNTGTVPAELRSTTLLGGSPGGAASSGPVAAAPLLQLSQSSPWIRGAVSTLGFQGEPFGVFGLWLAPAASGSVSPLMPEPLYFPPSAAVLFGLLDATGASSLPVAVPNVLSLQNVPFWIQALQITGPVLTLRASTIAGGTIR
ncbi:MAG: hypothetical protein MUC36_13080 [Planctomycetes bacterium]|jgi:hypothetical protein|nr:hypothetical protein [Planctomycetota bacterium]